MPTRVSSAIGVAVTLLLGISSVVLSSGRAGAVTNRVDPDGSGDFPTIAAAISAATDGDIIELGDGIFEGDGNRDLEIQGKAVTIRSASGDADLCIIDCGGSELSPHRGFYLHEGEGAGTVIENLTIRAGYHRNGGAISISTDASPGPSIIQCVLKENSSSLSGGGLYCAGEVDIVDCLFLQNQGGELAGGILVFGNWSISGSTLAGNEANNAAAVHSTGNARISHCTIVDNVSGFVGDLLHLRFGHTQVEHCIIAENPTGEPVYCCCDGTVELTCCNIFGNGSGDWVACALGLEGTNGNVSVDPLFCRGGSSTEPYSLMEGSPCLDPAQPECGLVGAWGEGCEDTPIHVASWGKIKSLFNQH